MTRLLGLLVVSVASVLATTAVADQYHYNNIVMGERAMGMGGAFTAVADDASGVVYNPAGLAFALSSEVSGSANMFYERNVKFKKAAAGEDFEEKSTGSFSPFVGALGKLDHLVPGLVWAFGIYSTDSELKDQDDKITGSSALRFHRTANVRADTNRIGVAVGKRFGSKFSMGFGLNYIKITELTQIYQDSRSAKVSLSLNDDGTCEKDANGNCSGYVLRYLNQNIRDLLLAEGIEPVLGMQLAIGEVAFGLTIKKGIVLNQKFERSQERTISYTDSSGKVIDSSEAMITTATSVNDDGEVVYTNTAAGESHRAVGKIKEDSPLGDLPMEVRTGLAWFASQSFLTTFDVIYHSATDGDMDLYDREAVTDFAWGMEYYLSPSWPLRFGLFTNNDARTEPAAGNDGFEHIDYQGASLFLANAQPNSQISAGAIYQQGTGKARKSATSTDIQEVEASSLTYGITVSHSF